MTAADAADSRARLGTRRGVTPSDRQRLNSAEFEFLRRVLERRDRHCLRLWNKLPQRRQRLTEDERESIRRVVADEFSEAGVGPDYEPNDYGLQMERLIDALGCH